MIARTDKQREIMRLVLEAMDAGELVSIHQIHARVPWKASKSAIQCSCRFLAEHGMITKERKPKSRETFLRPTAKAYSTFRRIPEV